MKKILFVINTMGRAGAEKSLIELLKVFDKGQYEIHLLSLIGRGEMFNEVPEGIKVLNKRRDCRPLLGAKKYLFAVVLKSIFARFNFLRLALYLVVNLFVQIKRRRIQWDKLLWRVVSEGALIPKDHYDVAIAYLEGGAAHFVADRVNADKKAVFVHIDYNKAGYNKHLDHGCFDKLDQIYIVSKEAKKSFLDVYPQYSKKVHLFNNIVNPEEIKDLSIKKTAFQDDFKGTRIVTVARLHNQKAIDLMIPAFAKLKAMGYPLRWYVIGDGELRGKLEQLIDELDVKGEFILLGSKKNPYPYIRESDLYVQVSRYEGKSIAIQEAQVLGKAIVASDCSGTREQIKHMENGILVKAEVDDIVDGIRMVLDDNELKKKLEKTNRKVLFYRKQNINLLYRWIGETK